MRSPDIQTILDELGRLPLRGIVHIKAAYIRKLLSYVSFLERALGKDRGE